MAVSATSSSLSYDVFISFRGEDTRLGFTGFLYKTLSDRGIRTFFDHHAAEEPIKAIEESKSGVYAQAMNVHKENSFDSEKLMKWKDALKQAANFSGCHFKHGDGYEYELIERIVDVDMGREIVRQESPNNPGKRSRLWFTKDIVEVLEKDTGTSEIQTIILDFPKYEKVSCPSQRSS
ncbi:hypothetical protein P8452_74575 [Trifolium repens]|nr:hypothetical protein P8452_74575 [Trifolium repens]